MEHAFSESLRRIQEQATTVARDVAGPNAEQTDRLARWPRESMEALAQVGLLGMHVDQELGGMGQGLLALVVATEALGRRCASSAMCFGMHSVATAVMAAKPTPAQRERYLAPIAEGRHITSLALSEAGSGAHFYLPQTQLTETDDGYLIDGTKHFVTSGGEADSYVISTVAAGDAAEGDFSCVVADAGTEGLIWLDRWEGLGMRGNSSRAMRLEHVLVPHENLLGEQGDQVWYVFEVVAPYFLLAMAGTYLGVASGALEYVTRHLRSRSYSHSGESLSNITVLQHRLAELWAAVEKSRLLAYHAARLGDLGDGDAIVAILSAKADVANTVVHVTNEAMTLAGGIAYRANDELGRALRDARASHVMTPTTDILRVWTGRALLGLPLL